MFDLVFPLLSKAILHALHEVQLTVKQVAGCREEYFLPSNSTDSHTDFSMCKVVLVIWNMRSQF